MSSIVHRCEGEARHLKSQVPGQTLGYTAVRTTWNRAAAENRVENLTGSSRDCQPRTCNVVNGSPLIGRFLVAGFLPSVIRFRPQIREKSCRCAAVRSAACQDTTGSRYTSSSVDSMLGAPWMRLVARKVFQANARLGSHPTSISCAHGWWVESCGSV